jgi:hypothetical protein
MEVMLECIRFQTEDFMAATLTVRDETTTGDTISSFPLEFPTERITVRDLIRERVYQEVQDYNRRGDATFRGLVQPAGAEQVQGDNRKSFTYRLPRRREINWKEQFENAIEAFVKNGFFILIDNKQAEELDQEVIISRGTQVSFIKLVQLVGG